MPLDEIHIEQVDGKVVAHLFPSSYVEIDQEKEATEKVSKTGEPYLVDTGKLGGKIVPVNVYYPEGYDIDEVAGNSDGLFDKKQNCPLCARRQAEVLKRFKNILESEDTDEDKRKSVNELVAELRAEVDQLKMMQVISPVKDEMPLPQAPDKHHYLGAKYDYLFEKEYRMMESIHTAHTSFLEMIKQILTPPKLPSFGEVMHRARGQMYVTEAQVPETAE